jgi:site-specific DNA recombinase
MIAEYEKAQISERTRRGKRHRAQAGFVNALTGAPFGYRYVRKAEWHDDDLMGGFCEKSWQ